MLRLYSKDRRKEVTDALDVAFTKYCAQRFSKNVRTMAQIERSPCAGAPGLIAPPCGDPPALGSATSCRLPSPLLPCGLQGGPVCMATPRRAAAAGGVGGAALPGHETLLRREQAQLESSVYKRPRPGGAGGRAGAAGAGRGGGGAGPSSQPGPGPSTQQVSPARRGASGCFCSYLRLVRVDS